jgi:UDP-N-acetylmuramoylalanine--D-glutamate ligase
MFKDNKIFVLGMARSGYEVAKLLAKRGNKVILNSNADDEDENHIKDLKELGVELILGSHPENLLDNSFDYVVKNPGVKETHDYVMKARELNIPVINEVEVAYMLLPEDVYIVAITGSNGKTTTTTLTYEILKEAKLPVILGGNIGYPLSGLVDTIKPKDILVLEISVQQLFNLDRFKTNISILTNIYNTHIELTGTKEKYIELKKKIFNHHTKDDYAVLNYDNEDVTNMTSDILSHKQYFSTNSIVDGCYIKDNTLYYNKERIIDLNDIFIKGMHNYENVMSAVIVAKILNVNNEVICKVLKEFKGVEHRIEYVREINGIKVYNDSKSTNMKACQTALSSFLEPTVLILGGMERGGDFNELKEYFNNVKIVVAYGETKNKIKEFCDTINIDCIVVDNLKEATELAYKSAIKGDIILLSPACASWDQFKDYEERGRLFKEYINNL